jgi:hypothetical protein
LLLDTVSTNKNVSVSAVVIGTRPALRNNVGAKYASPLRVVWRECKDMVYLNQNLMLNSDSKITDALFVDRQILIALTTTNTEAVCSSEAEVRQRNPPTVTHELGHYSRSEVNAIGVNRNSSHMRDDPMADALADKNHHQCNRATARCFPSSDTSTFRCRARM